MKRASRVLLSPRQRCVSFALIFRPAIVASSAVSVASERLSGVCYIVLIVYIKDVIFLRATLYGLGASHISSIPKCNTTSYKLTLIRYLGPNSFIEFSQR